jgi:hypothetical protein
MVDRLPDATMSVIDGESHLGGLGIAEDVITTLVELPLSGRTKKSASGR